MLTPEMQSFAARSVLCWLATADAPIVAPSHRLYPDVTTEQAQIEGAMRSYGVRPAGKG